MKIKMKFKIKLTPLKLNDVFKQSKALCLYIGMGFLVGLSSQGCEVDTGSRPDCRLKVNECAQGFQCKSPLIPCDERGERPFSRAAKGHR